VVLLGTFACNSRNASKPPADAPIPTTGKGIFPATFPVPPFDVATVGTSFFVVVFLCFEAFLGRRLRSAAFFWRCFLAVEAAGNFVGFFMFSQNIVSDVRRFECKRNARPDRPLAVAIECWPDLQNSSSVITCAGHTFTCLTPGTGQSATPPPGRMPSTGRFIDSARWRRLIAGLHRRSG